ncbi:fumarate hydratase, class II [Paragonimus westermani]|uniref:fumarate hydratase n=1 Tax=Paragonimus westermani TaxID=34504 RepID=A0A5J4P1R9_9TREM|nr:fumarate hydratase, class II [Paragonimus westermani]
MYDCGRQLRVVEDSFGKIELPADCHYGAQTERSKRNFPICVDTDRMPFRGNQTGSLIDLNFVPAKNKFAALSGHDGLLQLSGAFNATATVLFKLANDFALLSSGPNCGLGELLLPPNEPGSSIMPGKVNPTQCEALSMVAVQVMGNHFTVTLAASHGQLQLNVYKPIIIANMLHSCRLISDAVRCFADNCVSGLQVNSAQIGRYVGQSLMLVTALSPHIGYDRAASLAKHAQEHGLTLRDAAVQLQMMNPEEFDRLVQPRVMAFPFGDSSIL